MALDNKHSINTFNAKILWILLLVLHEFNLVICDDLEDDSLKKALEAIELRQRDLEFPDNEYFGQPENIGYGFQKTLGFFDSSGEAANLGSFDSNPKNDNDLQNVLYNYQRARDYEKRKSNFRERMSNSRKNYLTNDRDESGNFGQNNIEYLQMLKNLWSKYRESQNPYLDLEDLTDEQVEEILNSFDDRDGTEQYSNNYGSSESNGFEPYEAVFNRRKKNYRVFERLNHKKKRYSNLVETFPRKRNYYPEIINYENPPDHDFFNSYKYMNPELNREALENLPEESLEVLDDEKAKDLIRVPNNPNSRSNYYENDDPYWLKNQNDYNEEIWLQKPVMLSSNRYENGGRNDKRMEIAPRFFKNHKGVNLNLKRYPVKRNSIRIKKEPKNEEVSKELKEIFDGPSSTTSSPSEEKKEKKEKKPIETVKKQNVTKPIVTKHREVKKVVRRENHSTKEQVFPVQQNEEIKNIFSGKKKTVNKKSIDWSQYFGIDKRNTEDWLNKDYLRRAESHFLTPKQKRNIVGISKGNYYDPQKFQVPFDTRRFSKKNYPYELGSNIEKVESKIGDIEEKIIANAIKYTGAHTGDNEEDINRVKNKVIQHLETAYNLEKMKNALEEFKSFITPENKRVNEEDKKKTDTKALQKLEGPTTGKESQNLETIFLDKKPDKETNKEVATKKGAKNIYNQQLAENVEFLNDDSYPRRFYSAEECPVLNEVHHNCLQVEEANGKYADLLTPLCSLQQLCYFCGSEIGFSKLSMCDSLYLSEAQNVCQDNKECLIKARNSLIILKDLHEQDVINEKGRILFSGSCLSNVCVQRYFLNSPGGIFSLEVQK